MPKVHASDPWFAALSLLSVVFILVFTAKAIQIHSILGSSAYDLGIADQNVWLMSQLETPFNTIRGLNTHGDHFRPIEMLFAPLYRIAPSVSWFFLFQSISVGLGAVLIYRIGQALDLTSKPTLFLVGITYLANPAVHNPLLWQYHSAVLAAAIYFGWILSYLRQRLPLFIVLLIALLSVREDMFATTATFGLILIICRQWKYGTWALGISVIWFLCVFFIILPLTNGQGYFRLEHGSAGGLLEKAMDLGFIFKRFHEDPATLKYWAQLFSPVAFLPLGQPLMLAPALPSLLANTLIGAYNVNIDYHYNFNAIPFVYFATLLALSRLRQFGPIYSAPFILFMLIATGYWVGEASKIFGNNVAADLRRWSQYAETREDLQRIHREAGPEKGISASDFLVPFLSQRKAIYLFPNPWKSHYWGIRGENPHHPNEVDMLVLSPGAISRHYALIYYLVDRGYFERTVQNAQFSVYQRLQKEDDDPDVARNAADVGFLNNWPYYFRDLHLGPVLATPAAEFDRLDIQPADGPPADWGALQHTREPILDIDFVKLHGAIDFATAYLYGRVGVPRDMWIIMRLGSDDGVSVWMNGKLVWENLSRRAASLGSDEVKLFLRRGDNHFYFRVNNATANWRLLAFLEPVSIAMEQQP